MPDPKETVAEPTEGERKTAFAPHKGPAPEQQADGDPGNERLSGPGRGTPAGEPAIEKRGSESPKPV